MTQPDRPSCSDPIECSHEAALGEARETNRRLNLRAQRLESELAAYRRAVGQWEVSKRGTYIPHSSLRAIGLASGKDILGSVRHLKHFERVEQAEAAIERVRLLHDNLVASAELTSPDDPITRGAAAKRIAAALDGWTDLAAASAVVVRRATDETPGEDEEPACDHDSQVIDHEGAQFWACMKCGTNLGRADGGAQQQLVCKCPAEICQCGHHQAQQPKAARP
jgi:hypothetical protein